MNDSKPAWASKTLWVNLIALLVSVGAAFGVDLGLDTEAQASLVGGIMAVVNIVLRVMTTQPVTVKKQ
mgnify:CR=1 FL=1